MSDEEADDGTVEPLEDCEVLAFKIEMTLVPEWSNLVEKICTHHGERVAVALEDDQMVVKVAVRDENKPGMLRDLQSFWDEFVKRRELEGRWSPQ